MKPEGKDSVVGAFERVTERALRAVVNHWNEFGPEHGFGEVMDHACSVVAALAAAGAKPETQEPVVFGLVCGTDDKGGFFGELTPHGRFVAAARGQKFHVYASPSPAYGSAEGAGCSACVTCGQPWPAAEGAKPAVQEEAPPIMDPDREDVFWDDLTVDEMRVQPAEQVGEGMTLLKDARTITAGDGLPYLTIRFDTLAEVYRANDEINALATPAPHQPVSAEAARLLRMVIDDMDVCCGEHGADYKFQELSTETVEAIRDALSLAKGGDRG